METESTGRYRNEFDRTPRQRKRTSKLLLSKEISGSKAKKRGASRDVHASSHDFFTLRFHTRNLSCMHIIYAGISAHAYQRLTSIVLGFVTR